jgi:hypothetical protein
MEQALFLPRDYDLSGYEERFTRLYFGKEFCERQMPSLSHLRRIVEFAGERGLALTYVTPAMTDAGFDRLFSSLDYLRESADGVVEVVLNDWGVFEALRDRCEGFELVLGRGLSKQERGPRILGVWREDSPEFVQHFRTTGMDSEIVQDYLLANGIGRIEFDNLLHGIERRNTATRASLYHPFSFLSMARACYSNSFTDRRRPANAIYQCRSECLKHSFRLRNPDFPCDLFIHGNAYFFENPRLPDDLEAMNIDRLVYQPQP